jgi:hypothetical protein
MRYSFDYIGHDNWHVTAQDVSLGYWLLSTDTVRAFLRDYFDDETLALVMTLGEFDAVNV